MFTEESGNRQLAYFQSAVHSAISQSFVRESIVYIRDLNMSLNRIRSKEFNYVSSSFLFSGRTYSHFVQITGLIVKKIDIKRHRPNIFAIFSSCKLCIIYLFIG